MKKLLVLGAGTAGTMVVNRLCRMLDCDEWQITIVDQNACHHYQPGYLFIPFGMYGRGDVVRHTRDYVPAGVELLVTEVELIEPEKNRVRLAELALIDGGAVIFAGAAQCGENLQPRRVIEFRCSLETLANQLQL